MKLVESPEAALAHFNLDLDMLSPNSFEKVVFEDGAAKAAEDGKPFEPELTEEQQTALYEEVVHIDATIEALTARKEQIKDLFRRLDYGTAVVHREAQGKVTIGHNPVFNKDKFLEELPYDYSVMADVIKEDKLGRKRVVQELTYPNRPLYKIEPNRPEAKRILGDKFGAYMDEGMKKVTIR